MEVQWEAILKGRRARHTTLREEEEAESGGNLESVVPLRSLILLHSCFSVALWNDMDLDSSVRSSFIHTLGGGTTLAVLLSFNVLPPCGRVATTAVYSTA